MNNSESSSTNPSAVQGACPTGWHLPSDNEWEQLALYINELKGPFYKANNGTWSQIGYYLKSNSVWNEFVFGDFRGQNGNDEFGFLALPYAYVQGGKFCDYGGHSIFWSTTESGQYSSAWKRTVHFYYKELGHYPAPYNYGAQVRCVKD